MIKITDIPLGDQVFSHKMLADGVVRHFAVTQMQKAAKQQGMTIFEVAMEKDFGSWLIENHGINVLRVEQIMLSKELYDQPVLYLEMDDGSHLLADGNHRYVARDFQHEETIKAYMLKKWFWTNYLIDVSGMETVFRRNGKTL